MKSSSNTENKKVADKGLKNKCNIVILYYRTKLKQYKKTTSEETGRSVSYNKSQAFLDFQEL